MAQASENSIYPLGTMGEPESGLFGGSIPIPYSAPFPQPAITGESLPKNKSAQGTAAQQIEIESKETNLNI